jgi:hypothetical protein
VGACECWVGVKWVGVCEVVRTCQKFTSGIDMLAKDPSRQICSGSG